MGRLMSCMALGAMLIGCASQPAETQLARRSGTFGGLDLTFWVSYPDGYQPASRIRRCWCSAAGRKRWTGRRAPSRATGVRRERLAATSWSPRAPRTGDCSSRELIKCSPSSWISLFASSARKRQAARRGALQRRVQRVSRRGAPSRVLFDRDRLPRAPERRGRRGADSSARAAVRVHARGRQRRELAKRDVAARGGDARSRVPGRVHRGARPGTPAPRAGDRPLAPLVRRDRELSLRVA